MPKIVYWDMNGKISLSAQFFKKELLAYSNWKQAFWREMFQNSVDAGASEINIKIDEGNNGGSLIYFKDDGCGMEQDVLLNVFFNLGETTKTENEIGGFGRARMITCFAHKQYTIISKGYFVSGSGSQFQILQADQEQIGCEFRIEMEEERVEMLAHLKTYLSLCNMAPRVIVNGEVVDRSGHKGRLVRELTFGKIFVNKSLKSQKLIVRSNGVAMFERNINYPGQVVLDIPAPQTRKTLTANRDGLLYDYQREFNEVLNLIAIEARSYLREKFEPVEQFFGGFVSTIRKETEQIPQTEEPIQTAQFASVDAFLLATTCQQDEAPKPDLNYIHLVQTAWRKLRAASKKYLPERIKPGSGKFKILKLWEKSCAIAVEELLKITQIERAAFATGFVFNEDAVALCVSRSGYHALLLNPIGEDGKCRFKSSQRQTIPIVLAIACHEATHIDNPYHNEDFASLYTKLVGNCMARIKELK